MDARNILEHAGFTVSETKPDGTVVMEFPADFDTLPEGEPTFHLGQRVEYRGRWGRGHAQPGTISGIGEVREGTPYAERVYDVDLDSGTKHWGYPDQFTALRAIHGDAGTFLELGKSLSQSGQQFSAANKSTTPLAARLGSAIHKDATHDDLD